MTNSTATRPPAGTAAAVVGRYPSGGWPADLRSVDPNELGRRLYPLAVKLATRDHRRPLDDDAVAETWLRLWRAIVFDLRDGHGAKPLTYACASAAWSHQLAARQAIIVGPKSLAADRRFRRHGLAGEDEETGRTFGMLLADPTPEPLVHAADVADWRALAGPRPWAVLEAVTLGGETAAEAADRLGLSRRRVDGLAALAVRRINAGLVARKVAAGRATATGDLTA